MLCSFSFLFLDCSSVQKSLNEGIHKKEYGVFLGVSNKMNERLQGYETLVIEPSAFDATDIAIFHKSGQKVFGYLNVGALENYRSYYAEYERFALGVYEDWPDEKWMDVSKKEWQDFVVNTLALGIKEKGFDGFFVDNTDVYYNYRREEIYEGLISILKKLKSTGLKIIINGGDTFVSKVLDEGENVFDCVNQECVFTSIDFKANRYKKQKLEATEYFLEYLQKVRKHKKLVYLLEYGASKDLKDVIDSYCKNEGFVAFISKDKNLTHEKSY